MAKSFKFKAIVSRKRADGTFAEVGMNDRTIIEGNSIVALHSKAQEYFCANGKAYRLEVFPFNNIHQTPLRVDYRH